MKMKKLIIFVDDKRIDGDVARDTGARVWRLARTAVPSAEHRSAGLSIGAPSGTVDCR